MQLQLPLLKDANVAGKRVLLRSDLDVPLIQPSATSHQQLVIEDDTRLRDGLPTIEHLLKNGATVIVAGHLGRPGGVNEGFSLEPAANWFSKNISHTNGTYHRSDSFSGFSGWKISDNLALLENLRFDPGEERNDPEFAKKLAALANMYINDAFSVVHRAHASVVGVAQLLPHFAGLRLQKEIEVFSSILHNPKRPLVVIIGGAKMETKLPVISHMAEIADHVLVGGKIALEAKDLPRNVVVAQLTSDGFDITAESIATFIKIIQKAKTIVWNGPLGLIQPSAISHQPSVEDTEKGTREVAQAVAESSAYKIVGGGDTLGYLQRVGIIDKFDFVSTGGGAMLTFLAGEKLPGLEALLL